MTLAAAPSDEMAHAFYAADPDWDGRFVAAVRTTGIFCRPGCRVRKPLPQNVSYLADAAAARAAGYRACLRCHPEAGSTVRTQRLDTPVGSLLVGATDSAVVLCDFAERPIMGAQLGEYFAGERRAFDLPIDAPGSAFQERVWDELKAIPYGATISYRELAARVGVPAASRAVGRANGSNRLAVIIPCHRVIAAGGGLGGYGGGLAAKRLLLDLEAR